MPISISILGLGKMGENHLRVLNLMKNVDIKFIYDENIERLNDLSKTYNVEFTQNLDKALDNCDAVYISTPTNTHLNLFQKCCEKVENIFLEKPPAANLKDSIHIQKLSKSNNNFVQCGFIERFNPTISSLKNILKKNKTINIDFMRTNKLSSRIKDVDVVVDLMVHDIDLALYLNGPVERVFAFNKKERNRIVFSNAILNHKNGSTSRLQASRITEKKIRSLEVTTKEEFIEAELLQKVLIVNKQSQILEDNNIPYQIDSIRQQIEVPSQEPLLLENQAFIKNCLTKKKIPVPNLESSLRVMDIANQIINFKL